MSPAGGGNPADLYGDAIHDEYGTYQPTLGPTWHHCVSTRLTMRLLPQLQNNGSGSNTGSSSGGVGPGGTCTQMRCLSITKSPVAPPFELNVIIASKGVTEHI